MEVATSAQEHTFQNIFRMWFVLFGCLVSFKSRFGYQDVPSICTSFPQGPQGISWPKVVWNDAACSGKVSSPKGRPVCPVCWVPIGFMVATSLEILHTVSIVKQTLKLQELKWGVCISKSSMVMGFSSINHFGVPPFMDTPKWVWKYKGFTCCIQSLALSLWSTIQLFAEYLQCC